MFGHPNRIGRFKVSKQFLDRWMDLIHMMGNFVVVRADWRWDSQEVEYLAYSPLFDECPKACVAPEYNMTIGETIWKQQQSDALDYCGIPSDVPPAIKGQLGDFILESCLAAPLTAGLEIVRAAEAHNPGGNARYIGMQICKK